MTITKMLSSETCEPEQSEGYGMKCARDHVCLQQNKCLPFDCDNVCNLPSIIAASRYVDHRSAQIVAIIFLSPSSRAIAGNDVRKCVADLHFR